MTHSCLSFFSHSSHAVYLQTLSLLPLSYMQNLTNFHHLHHNYPGPSIVISTVLNLLDILPSATFVHIKPTLQRAGRKIILNCPSEHIIPQLKTSQCFHLTQCKTWTSICSLNLLNLKPFTLPSFTVSKPHRLLGSVAISWMYNYFHLTEFHLLLSLSRNLSLYICWV